MRIEAAGYSEVAIVVMVLVPNRHLQRLSQQRAETVISLEVQANRVHGRPHIEAAQSARCAASGGGEETRVGRDQNTDCTDETDLHGLILLSK